MSTPRPVWALGAALGEGPVWVEQGAALWFVDIKAPAIHRFTPGTGEQRTWAAPAQVGWVLPAEGGGMVAGMQTGVHRFDPATGAFSLIAAPEAHLPGNRLNDATVASDGAIWFGSMDDSEQSDTGRIYRLDADGAVDTGLPPVSVTNGPAFSLDGRTLYHHDTLGQTIWASTVEDGRVTDTRLFAAIEEGAGYPDGPVVDAEGCLWVSLFRGWGVRRYDPAGRLMATVPFPVANITKIAFGGPDLATAYATTAAKGLSAAELAAQPLAGALFAFDAGVAGPPGFLARV
ncbi:SMP-30/gluconolactonase/LRE family protein [Novosphingobium flavum]|uniref:SMP-30/gluconolactonase/LRE family protein n=1 Tax=Novosphingobium flavum TaxID=1778672 RepID=A0A7X1FUM0_9SPHN|nr:SMP-30/gluconolactonase/LRE family protein [Novosphingobium flavum]MBC2667298.1 SMP-30/gluconolactonase/LRE family protein [Novosphingobium flavum]